VSSACCLLASLTVFKDIQIFLGFANFYQYFIKNFSRIAVPLTSMLKNNVNRRKADFFRIYKKAKIAFEFAEGILYPRVYSNSLQA
jgi:hypothetical protein